MRFSSLTCRTIIGFLLFGVFSAVAEPEARPVTYSKDVAPILEGHCVVCHRAGQIAPMSLRTYDEVRPWAKSIVKQVSAREMPPFSAAGPIGRYRDDPRLTEQEIATIVKWVESGAREGDPKHLPKARHFDADGWALGKPDLTITFPEYLVPAESQDDYVQLYSQYVFEEDLWVKGAELKPANYRTIHHANLFIWPPERDVPEGLVKTQAMEPAAIFSSRMLLPWTPGLNPQLLPARQAIHIPKGSRLVMDAHFGPISEPTVAQPKLGLYLANGIVDPHALKEGGTLLADLVIEPFDPHSEHSGHFEFKEDAFVTHFKFHMHYRGKSCKVVFHYPDGSQETAIDIPTWDFYWQQAYFLAEPMFVPKGTIAELFGVWDNSPANPLNPDPSKRVRWGSRTRDEMYGGNVYYSPATPDPNAFIAVSNGRVVSK